MISGNVYWPAIRLGEAIVDGARHANLVMRDIRTPKPDPRVFAEGRDESGATQRVRIGEWIVDSAEYLGLEIEPVSTFFPDVAAMLGRVAPAVFHLSADVPKFVVLVGANGSMLQMLGRDGVVYDVPIDAMMAAVAVPLEAQVDGEVEVMLDAAGLAGSARTRARTALINELLGTTEINRCYLLKNAPARSATCEFFASPVIGTIVLQIAAYALALAFTIAAFWGFGTAIFADRIDSGRIAGIAVAFATAALCQLVAQWAGGRVTLDVAARMKERLLVGALRLTPEATRGDGVGMHLARALEADALQVALVGGALQGVMSILELIAAVVVAWSSAGGGLLALFIMLWTAGGLSLAIYYAHRRREWTSARLTMTNHTVERLVGHSTRVVQESQVHWHDDEDAEMASYFERSVSMDRIARWMTTLSARGFFLACIAVLAPFLASASLSPAAIGVMLGAVLLAQRAFAQLGASATLLVDVALGWRALSELFASAGQRPALPLIPVTEPASPSSHGSGKVPPLVEARAVSFRYEGRSRMALQDASLSVFAGDRVLIEGSSGGGKSTLSSVLSGTRDASTGLVFAGGLDRATLGESGWRRHVIAAPQFHENYIFSGTFAFNVLLGRRWPATEEQIAEAEVLCRQLALGPLLDRMPAGMRTMLGESGWQLSHGERSRVFMARTLLQRADVTVFDETFGALDPETLADCLMCAMEKSNALVVVAHP